MDTYLIQLKKKVIDALVGYSRFSDLAIMYQDFLSIYTLLCISKGDFLDDFDKSKISSLLNSESSDIDFKLNELFAYIENRYEELHGVFNRIDTSSHYSKDSRDRNIRIHNVLVQLSQLNISVFDGTCGKIYNALLDFISKSAGKTASEHYTPSEVIDLMIEIISPEENKTIYDPVCGSGGFLIQATEFIKSKSGDLSNSLLYGQEINRATWQAAKQNLLVNNLFQSCICLGDTLLNPSHMDPNGQISKYDYVLANPPFSLKSWEHQHDFAEDLRFKFGIPPKNNADYAFLQHCFASLKDGGRAAIIVSSGSLFRMGIEGEIRQRLIEEKIIEAIISLPSNLFHGTSISPNIIILNKSKESEDILFIDASELIKVPKSNVTLSDEHISLILSLYNQRKASKELCAVISINQILKEESGVLSVSSYVKKEHFHNVDESFFDLQTKQTSLTNRLAELEDEMLKIIKS